MDGVNKTLYIPLYGKSCVSKRGIILKDKKAEEIWEAEGFKLRGKSRSRWLALYMGIRAAVFDDWVIRKLQAMPDAVVVHIGCGLDSRNLRIGAENRTWYDMDFPEVIGERKRYYAESAHYRMLPGDVRDDRWLSEIPEGKCAIVVMEGVSMYLTGEEVQALTRRLCAHFAGVALLMDCYTVRAARLTKYKNPINDVGVTQVYGIDNPEIFAQGSLVYVREHEMTPQHYIDSLQGLEKHIFAKVFAGGFSQKLYRLFEYAKA